MVSYALVFCRFMGSDDESSTDEEQAEKLLYFYPSSLSIGERLSKINMVEGLIEFTNKFSKEKLGSIVMDNDIWGFYECEPQVWIAIAVPRRKEIPEIDGRFCHRSSAKGVSLFLQQFYQLFSTFNGSIYKSLEGSNLVGFEIIDRVRDLRKNIRKLTKALDQSRRDESFVSSISSDNIVNNETINEHNISVVGNYKSLVDIQKEAELIEEQLAAKGSALEVIINSQSYTPDKVREFLNRFMQLCLQQENPTFFSHLTPSLGYRRAEINSLMHLPLCRMREAVAESSQNLILGNQALRLFVTANIMCMVGIRYDYSK